MLPCVLPLTTRALPCRVLLQLLHLGQVGLERRRGRLHLQCRNHDHDEQEEEEEEEEEEKEQEEGGVLRVQAMAGWSTNEVRLCLTN